MVMRSVNLIVLPERICGVVQSALTSMPQCYGRRDDCNVSLPVVLRLCGSGAQQCEKKHATDHAMHTHTPSYLAHDHIRLTRPSRASTARHGEHKATSAIPGYYGVLPLGRESCSTLISTAPQVCESVRRRWVSVARRGWVGVSGRPQ